MPMQQIWNIYRPTIHSNMQNYFLMLKVIKLLLFIKMENTEQNVYY